MPGKQVRNWKKYHALRRRGYSKASAARITNSRSRTRRRTRRRPRRTRRR